jgi:hypothetical protein
MINRFSQSPRRAATILASVLALAAGTAHAQTTFSETEANDTKGAANPITLSVDNDKITGSSTGSSTSTAGTTSADYFLVTTAPQTVGVYKRRLTLSSTSTGLHTGTIRGLGQSNGVLNTVDAAPQSTTTGTGAIRYVQWYGFGKQEQLYFRVTGLSSTTPDPYFATYTSTPVSVVNSTRSFFNAGPITIAGATAANTDLWLYDSNLNAIVDAGNDTNTVASGGTGTGSNAVLRRTLLAGTYYIAISQSNLSNNLPSPADDGNRGGVVVDFPNIVTNNSTTLGTDLSFTISDGTGSPESFSLSVTEPFQVSWVKFVVAGDPPIIANGNINPATITPGSTQALITVAVTPSGGANNAITSVTANLTALDGSATAALNDSGVNGDAVAGDGTYSLLYNVPNGPTPGAANVSYMVTDASNRTALGNLPITVAASVPVNDLCTGAITLTDGNLPYNKVVGINLATADMGSSCSTTTDKNSIWYVYTPSTDRVLSAWELGSRSVDVSVWTGSCGSLTEYFCETTEDDANVPVFAGQTYYIMFAGGTASTNANDTYTISIKSGTATPPVNDLCAGATPLTPSASFQSFPAGGATSDQRTTCQTLSSQPNESRNGIWFTYTTGPTNEAIRVRRFNDNQFFSLAFYTGDCIQGLTDFRCENLGTTTTGTIVALRANTTYYILAHKRSGYLAADANYQFVFERDTTIPAPTNDDCETAMEFTSAPFSNSARNVLAFDDQGVPCVSGSSSRSRNGVWYKFTATFPTEVNFRENSSQDAFITIFSGACGNLEPYWCNLFSPLADVTNRLRLAAGQTYYFLVAREANSNPAEADILRFDVQDISIASPPPANDLCSNAKRLITGSIDEVVYYAGATADYRTSVGSPNFCSAGTATIETANAVWYRYDNGPSFTNANAWTTDPDNFPSPTQIAIFEGGCPFTFDSQLLCDSSSPRGISWTMNPNTSYYIMIGTSAFYPANADELMNFHFRALTQAAPPVPNGSCAAATLVTSMPFSDFKYSFNAPTAGQAVACNSAGLTDVNNAIWYSYTATQNGHVAFSEEGPQDAVLAAFTSCGSSEVRCASNADVGVVAVTAGNTYYFMVGRFGNSTSAAGDFWDVRLSFMPTATNDTCATAKPMASFPFYDTVSYDDLTDDDLAIAGGCSGATPQRWGAWYSFVARDNFVVLAQELGPQTSKRWALFSGDCNNLVQVGCSTNSSTGTDFDTSSPVIMSVVAGQTYYLLTASSTASPNAERQFHDIVVYGFGSDVGRCTTGTTCTLVTRQNCTGTFLPGKGACPADFDCQNGANIDDIFIFINAWFAQDPRTDVNNDGNRNIDDIFIFINIWFAGCP